MFSALIFIFLPISMEAQWIRSFGTGGDISNITNLIQIEGGEFFLSGYGDPIAFSWLKGWIQKVSVEGENSTRASFTFSPISEIYAGSHDAYSIQQTSDSGFIFVGNAHQGGYLPDYKDTNNIFFQKLSPSGDMVWHKTYGALGFGPPNRIYSIKQTKDDGYVAVGEAHSSGSGGADVLVLKLDSDGDILWQLSIGGSQNDTAFEVWQLPDWGYLVACNSLSFGSGDEDIWILRLSATGEIIWQRSYGDVGNDRAFSMIVTQNNLCVLTGYTHSFGREDMDAWVVVLGLEGKIVWQKTYGGFENDWLEDIFETSDGGYIAGGAFHRDGDQEFLILRLSVSGDVIWNSAFGSADTYSPASKDNASEVLQTKNGDYVIAGITGSLGRDAFDVVILKFTAPEELLDCEYFWTPDIDVFETKILGLETDVSVTEGDLVRKEYYTVSQGQNELEIYQIYPKKKYRMRR
jgi:hypothetical protein